MADEKKSEGIFKAIIRWFKEAAEWVQENLGDPAIAATIREDLGLEPGEEIPAAEKEKFKQFAAGLDPDKEAFNETIAEIKDVVTAFTDLSEGLKSGDLSAFDVTYLIGKVAATESVRLRVPALYALAKLALFLSDDPDRFEELDPAMLVGLLRGDGPPLDAGERVVQRLSASAVALITISELIVEKFTSVEFPDAYYGWDPPPGSDTPQADLVSQRALTILIPPAPAISQLSITVLGVPPEHQGPGLFLSFGGTLTLDQKVGRTTYRLKTGMSGGLDLFIPLSRDARDFTAGGDPGGFVRLDVLQEDGDQPAVRIGEAGKSRLDIGRLDYGVEFTAKRAGFRLGLHDAALIIRLADAEGDGFLSQLPGGELTAGFDIGFVADTDGGFRIEGGSGLQTTLPIGRTLLGFFTVQHLTLALGPGRDGHDLGLELSGAFSLSLGPFQASLDRLGMQLDLSFREGNLGLIDLAVGLKPPSGVSLLLDAGVVKGGGGLFFDPQRHEYSGALELKIGPVGVKAIGVLTTRMPDGSEGWSLLLLIYAQFSPPIQLTFGFTLSGVGGALGLQHSASVDALQAGLRTRALDDILFPANPVADAPRIINRLRVVFPATPRALILGPMLELGWGTPNLVTVRLGVLIQLDNALGSGDQPLSLSKIVLIGQVRLQVPSEVDDEKVILKLLADILGVLDFDSQRFFFAARLRDSRLAGRLQLSGMLLVNADFGDQPTFILSAGGFHPKFKDLPPGMPSPIDRLQLSFPIGIVKVVIRGYFALTPATVQHGAEIKVSGKLGPVTFDGWLGFDAICYFEPTFHFIVDIRGGVTVKFKGRTLAGVTLNLTLEGPGRWRARGTATFSILFWDKEIDFDESWGEAPQLPPVTTDVGSMLQAALNDPTSYSAQLPAGNESLVTLASIRGTTEVLAHPLGQFMLTQKVAPLGVEIQRFGNSRVSGPRRFDLRVRIGDQEVPQPALTTQHFARAQFFDLTEEQKLSQPSFETFNAGVAVGTDAYQAAPAAVAADMSFETRIWDPSQPDRGTVREELLNSVLSVALLEWQAATGPAAASPLRANERLKAAEVIKVAVAPPPLAVVNPTNLETVAEVVLEDQAVVSLTLATQAAERAVEVPAQVVEAFEVA